MSDKEQNKFLETFERFCSKGKQLNKIETYYFKEALLDLGYNEEEVDKLELDGDLCFALKKTFIAADYVIEVKDNLTFWQTLKMNISTIAEAIYCCIVQLDFSRSPKIIYQCLMNILEKTIGNDGRNLHYLSVFIVYFIILPFYIKNNIINYVSGTILNLSVAYGIEKFFIYKDHVYSTVDRDKIFNLFGIKNNQVNDYKLTFDVSDDLLKAFKMTGYLFQNITDNVVNKERILRALLLKEVVSKRFDYKYNFIFYKKGYNSLFLKKDIPIFSRISPNNIREKIGIIEKLKGGKGLQYVKYKKEILKEIIEDGCEENQVPYKNLQETLINYDYLFDTLSLKNITVLHKNYDYDRVIKMADIYYSSTLTPIASKNFLVVKIWDNYFLLKGLSRLLTLSLIDIDKKIPCDIIDISSEENRGSNFKIYLRSFFELAITTNGIILKS